MKKSLFFYISCLVVIAGLLAVVVYLALPRENAASCAFGYKNI